MHIETIDEDIKAIVANFIWQQDCSSKKTHIIMSVGRFDDTIFSDQINIKSNYGWSLAQLVIGHVLQVLWRKIDSITTSGTLIPYRICIW